MNKFNPDDITKPFGSLLEGNNLDKKYPSAYLPQFIKKIVEFIEWAIAYIDDRISSLESRMDSKFQTVQNQMDASNAALEEQKKKLDDSNTAIEEQKKSQEKYTDDAIKKLRKDMGI